MNVLNKIALIFTSAFMTFMPMAADETVEIELCENPDEISRFTEGLHYGLNNWLSHEFKYPLEAWEADPCDGVIADLIIGRDGHVLFYTVLGPRKEKGFHPAFQKEFERVLKKMQFFPAYKDGVPVASKLNVIISLTPHFDQGRPIPFGLEGIVENGSRALKKLKAERGAFCNNDTVLLTAVDKAYRMDVSNPVYAIANAGLHAACGKEERSVDVLEKCWDEYRVPVDLGNMDSYNEHRMYMTAQGYSGKFEIWLALARALHKGRIAIENCDSAYIDALDLIDARIIDRKLYDDPEPWKTRDKTIERIKRYERSMVNEWTRAAVAGPETPTWQKITRQHDINELSAGLSYWSKQGMINNAQIVQLTNLIESEREVLRNGKKATTKNDLNVFGTKALTIWLRDGDEGLRGFLSQIKNGDASKQLKNYMANLEKNYDENASVLADRKGVIESLACLVPSQGTDEAGCRAFYERRRAAEKVFPLKWLQSN